MSKDTVLVVDDDTVTRGILREMLESEGFAVSCCESGASALALTKEKCYEVVVMDYRMPEMNGDEVARLMRPLCPDAFIIGFSVEDKDQAFLKAGANVFVEKIDLVRKLVLLIKNRNYG